MGGLASAFGRGLSAAGYAAGDVYAKGALADQAAAAQAERDARLAEIQEMAAVRADERREAPLRRMQGLIEAEAGVEVPSTFKGDTAAIADTINKSTTMRPEEKEEALAQLRNQTGGETRKRTEAEIKEAVRARAMRSDLPALAAYDTQIGRPQRDERRIDIEDKKAEAAARAAAGKEAWAMEREDRREAAAREAEDRRDSRASRAQAAAEERQRRSLLSAEERAVARDEAKTRAAADKPLAPTAMKQLQEVRDNATTVTNLANTFQDGFASKGVLGIGADQSIATKAVLGTDKDAVDWWKNYRKQAELVERHALFGASLTPGEQDSWRSADIGPGMDAEVIKRNLAQRAALAQRVLSNTAQDLIDAGSSAERVRAIAGRGAAPPPGKPSNEWGPESNANAPVTVQGDADFNRLPSGTLFVGPDGKTRRKP